MLSLCDGNQWRAQRGENACHHHADQTQMRSSSARKKIAKQILFHQIFLGQRHSVIVIISSWSLPGCLMITMQLSSSWSGSPRWALPSRGRTGRGSSLRTGTWSSHSCRSTRGFPGSHRPGRQKSHTFENFGGFLCFPWEKKGESKWWIVFKAESWWLRP